MKNFVKYVAALAGLFLSSVALAQTGDANNNPGMFAIGAALAVGIATFGAATGQSRAAASALEGIARNPGAKDAMFQPFILGLVFIEFQALLGFVIAILWTFK